MNTTSFAYGQPPLLLFSLQFNFTGETLAMSSEISAMTDLGRSFISRPVDTFMLDVDPDAEGCEVLKVPTSHAFVTES